MSKKRFDVQEFSHHDESIPLDSQFPIFMFYHNVSLDSISNLHCHNVLEVGLCLEGHGIFVLDNQIHTYKEGDIFVIGTGVYHRANSSSTEKNLWAFMHLKENDWGIKPFPEDLKLIIERIDHPSISYLISLCITEINEKKPGCEEIIKGLVISTASYFYRIINEQIQDKLYPAETPVGLDKRITKAMDLLINAKINDISIMELAHQCCLSESHFRKMFKEQVGITPKRFQTKIKLKVAMNLLSENQKRVLDISYDCGFNSLSSFNRQFKMETGLSPLQWRHHFHC